jgi:hypothetical protein
MVTGAGAGDGESIARIAFADEVTAAGYSATEWSSIMAKDPKVRIPRASSPGLANTKVVSSHINGLRRTV